MRRGLRGLVIVLGTLWVAASAGASTLLYANLWDGGAAPFEGRPLLVDQIIEDYAGPLNESPEAPVVSDGTPTRRLMPGAPRFGRRDFIWHPGPIIPPNLPLPTLPEGPVLYHPLGPFSPGPFTGFDGFGMLDMLEWLLEGFCSNLLLPRDFAGAPWQIPRDPVEVPSFPGPLLSPWYPFDGWDSTLTLVGGLESVQIDAAGLESNSFEGTSAGGDPSAASVAVSAIPEPATGALLLAGLCALAARRRRC